MKKRVPSLLAGTIDNCAQNEMSSLRLLCPIASCLETLKHAFNETEKFLRMDFRAV